MIVLVAYTTTLCFSISATKLSNKFTDQLQKLKKITCFIDEHTYKYCVIDKLYGPRRPYYENSPAYRIPCNEQ
jgi:hypothetical protein